MIANEVAFSPRGFQELLYLKSLCNEESSFTHNDYSCVKAGGHRTVSINGYGCLSKVLYHALFFFYIGKCVHALVIKTDYFSHVVDSCRIAIQSLSELAVFRACLFKAPQSTLIGQRSQT